MRSALKRTCAVCLAAAISIGLSACGKQAPTTTGSTARPFAYVDDERLANAQNEPENWLIYNGSWYEHRFSKLDQINVDTVAQLKPAWYVDYDTNRGQESTPIVVDGVMFVTTAWSKVYALDAKTGEQLWYFDPKVPGPRGQPLCCDVVNRGVAVYKGKVYLATIDGRLIAIDAKTGKHVWVARAVEPNSTYSITGAPRVARGKVFIGNAGADFGGRGYVSAYDAETGEMVWRFYTVPPAPGSQPDGAASDEVLATLAAPTWHGEVWKKTGGGGHVWNSIVYDPDFNHLYMATGNGLPWSHHIRSDGKGDNLFISSIIAVDADTGKYKWHYQETPGESWDYDAVSDMTLAELPINGQPRKVLIHPPKNGFLYVLDRETGKVISAEPYVPGVNWATHVDLTTGRPAIRPEARYKDKPFVGIPGGGGAHNWHPTAFSPQTGLLYLAATESSSYFDPAKNYQYVHLLSATGVNFANIVRGGPEGEAPKAPPPKAYLLAWDPVAQKAAWRAKVRGGVLATAGNLVFQGRSRQGVLGELAAFRADTGEEVWSYPTPNAINPGPITYMVDGEQYVAVSSGAGIMAVGMPARRKSGSTLPLAASRPWQRMQ
jgi:quinohemoprotein ethanol dehydrogenase